MRPTGALLCLASAVAFGAMGIFGKLAYDEGATVGTLLSVRFVLAAVLFWALVAATRRRARACARCRAATSASPSRSAPSATAPRPALLRRARALDASLLSLLLYTFPAMVTVAAIVLGRERASRRTAWRSRSHRAAWCSCWPGRRAGRSIRWGRRSGSLAAVIYSAYILTSEGVAGRVDPLVLSALVCTGAAVMLTLGDVAPAATCDGRRERAGLRLARRHGGGLDRRRRQPVLRRAAARRPDDRLDPLDSRAAGRRSCWRTSRSASRWARRSSPAERSSSRRRRARRPRSDARTPGPGSCAAARPTSKGDSMTTNAPLTGKVALVAGATRGAGRGIAVVARRGRRDGLLHRPHTRERRSEYDRPETIEETAELVTAAGGTGIAVAVDHLEPDQVEALVERIDAEQGRLDVLVNDIWGGEQLVEWNTPIWEHDLAERPAAAAPGDRHAPDHEPLRAAAADPAPGRAGRRDDRRHARLQRRELPALDVLRPREDRRSSGSRSRRRTSSRRTAARRWRSRPAGCARR